MHGGGAVILVLVGSRERPGPSRPDPHARRQRHRDTRSYAGQKAVVSHAVGLSVANPNGAQFRWPQIANTEDGNINYCGMVKANSPYGPYSGWQAYIVEGKIAGGKLSTAVVGLIAGGKDVDIVRKMCKKYGLDPGPAG